MTQSKSYRAGAANQNMASRWRPRLIAAAVVSILCGATVLALHAASPEIRALIAGEGTVFSHTDR
jgi:hypothetical protein